MLDVVLFGKHERVIQLRARLPQELLVVLAGMAEAVWRSCRGGPCNAVQTGNRKTRGPRNSSRSYRGSRSNADARLNLGRIVVQNVEDIVAFVLVGADDAGVHWRVVGYVGEIDDTNVMPTLFFVRDVFCRNLDLKRQGFERAKPLRVAMIDPPTGESSDNHEQIHQGQLPP